MTFPCWIADSSYTNVASPFNFFLPFSSSFSSSSHFSRLCWLSLRNGWRRQGRVVPSHSARRLNQYRSPAPTSLTPGGMPSRLLAAKSKHIHQFPSFSLSLLLSNFAPLHSFLLSEKYSQLPVMIIYLCLALTPTTARALILLQWHAAGSGDISCGNRQSVP